jgi:hypothetical protein
MPFNGPSYPGTGIIGQDPNIGEAAPPTPAPNQPAQMAGDFLTEFTAGDLVKFPTPIGSLEVL